MKLILLLQSKQSQFFFLSLHLALFTRCVCVFLSLSLSPSSSLSIYVSLCHYLSSLFIHVSFSLFFSLSLYVWGLGVSRKLKLSGIKMKNVKNCTQHSTKTQHCKARTLSMRFNGRHFWDKFEMKWVKTKIPQNIYILISSYLSIWIDRKLLCMDSPCSNNW